MHGNPERERMRDPEPWRKWGPYLSERQWGTVREDYSPDGAAWEYFPHEHARSRAYRWGEDGIAGISDERQRLCLALALWNGRDPILKERLFGLTGNQGNHGEDVKEHYYYLDAVPSHAWLRMLYKYPQAAFPYRELVAENARCGREAPELELIDTGVFDEDRYFDVFVEYAKARPEEILARVTAVNRGPDPASLHLLFQVWFRNTWSWDGSPARPGMRVVDEGVIEADHPELGRYLLFAEGAQQLLFTENETNFARVFDAGPGGRGFFKDAFHDHVVYRQPHAVNPARIGTKAAARYAFTIAPGGEAVIRLRLTDAPIEHPFQDFDRTMEARRAEADAYFADLQKGLEDPDARHVQRQAYAGMIWTKQFYHYDVQAWLDGDPAQPPPPKDRRRGRNAGWEHLNNADVISMPDKWEYPWYAAWDLAFHCLPLARLDPEFAKRQLVLLTREWYMHPNGQLPAYEWAFGDVNPPVHAWAAWRVYQIDRDMNGGRGDRPFLERVFHKLLLNFTWWVNRKDVSDRNIFQGGFLGLDNIGVFDRSAALPTGDHLDQADATSWMGMYCLNLMRIALELALENPVYEDVATKFFEHFLYIAGAMANIGGEGVNLWDEEDEFFYDVLNCDCNVLGTMKVRSLVGLSPLFAVEVLEPELLERVPDFNRRMEWFLDNRPELARLVSRWYEAGQGETRLLSLLRGHRMKRLYRRMLDESEFLSDYGVRALSRHHLEHPFTFAFEGASFEVKYLPAESDSALFGGNSNWRGPIWFPVNYLLVESMERFHAYYGDEFRIECPTGSGRLVTIREAALEIARRLTRIFLEDDSGRRPVFGRDEKIRSDPHFRDHILFYEYFHGDSGRGVGASHQTGWTGLITELLDKVAGTSQTRGADA